MMADPRSVLNVGTSDPWLLVDFDTQGGRMVRDLPREAWQAAADVLAARSNECPPG